MSKTNAYWKKQNTWFRNHFHRAFDHVKDPAIALKKLVSLGFDRVLTSGTKKNAQEGSEIISRLVHQAMGQIQIMAGCGVNENALQIVKPE